MLKLDQLDSKQNLNELLESKKKIHDLIGKVDNSMLQFHKEVKSLDEIETIANNYFRDINTLKEIRQNSGHINISSLTRKIDGIKPVQSDDIDFI